MIKTMKRRSYVEKAALEKYWDTGNLKHASTTSSVQWDSKMLYDCRKPLLWVAQTTERRKVMKPLRRTGRGVLWAGWVTSKLSIQIYLHKRVGTKTFSEKASSRAKHNLNRVVPMSMNEILFISQFKVWQKNVICVSKKWMAGRKELKRCNVWSKAAETVYCVSVVSGCWSDPKFRPKAVSRGPNWF